MTEEKSTQGNLVAIEPKVTGKVMFHYRGNHDLADLIQFVGKPAVIHSDLSIHFKKVEVKEGDYIEVNQYGEIISVLTPNVISKSFEIKGRKMFSKEDANKVIEKPARVKK